MEAEVSDGPAQGSPHGGLPPNTAPQPPGDRQGGWSRTGHALPPATLQRFC